MYICRLDIPSRSDEAGIWLYTRPKHPEAWYTKLGKSSDPQMVVNNFEEAVNSIDGNLCLVLKHRENMSPAFELRSVECEEKRSVICRTLSKTNTSPKPSSFPCMSRTPDNRDKRELTDFTRDKREVEGKICEIVNLVFTHHILSASFSMRSFYSLDDMYFL